MKKVMLAAVAITLAGVVHADLIDRTWSSQALGAVENVPAINGDSGIIYAGAGYDVGAVLLGSDSQLVPDNKMPVNGGWYDGYGYSVAGFDFMATEGMQVVMRMYNGEMGKDATYYIDSIPVTLADVEGAPPPGAFDVTFSYAPGSEWVEIVPEPATFGLMGIAGLGLFLARRKTQR